LETDWSAEHDPFTDHHHNLSPGATPATPDLMLSVATGLLAGLIYWAIAGRRDGLFIVSKVLPSNASYDGTRKACERTLRRLGIDRLDLYLLHWPGSHPIAETMRGLESLVRDGMTRLIGVSNFDVEELRGAQRSLKNERLASNQVLYHLGDRGIERKLIPYCREQGIAVMGYSPFGHRSFPKPSSKGGRVLAAAAEPPVPFAAEPCLSAARASCR